MSTDKIATTLMRTGLNALLMLATLTQAGAAEFSCPDAKYSPDLFAWTDTCNVCCTMGMQR